jgi:histidyl-tRNA synthetase
MRDFLPQEKARREQLLGVIRKVFSAHGFDEIETPVVEDSERLHAGLGGDNEKLAFAVMKRGLTTDDLEKAAESEDYLDLADLGLRFDLTVPLARFYATHRGQLPNVFRSIQIGSVWRAERPQKGRYRQFIQCDIDIIGEAGPLAEVELIVATVDAVTSLGLDGTTIRINDRRILTSMLEVFGFAADSHASVLITIDKMDKVGADGVITELRANLGDTAEPAIAALETFFARPRTLEYLTFGDHAIRRELPEGTDETAIADLVLLGDAVAGSGVDRAAIIFDPFLVRGMGYYTGTIFEIAHPQLSYSLGGGGRYDGMIGRFLGEQVPAVGFSLGFERLVDLIESSEFETANAVALVYDADVAPAALAALKSSLVAEGKRVRLERRTKNTKPLLEQLAASGFTSFAFVNATSTAESIEFRPLASQ